MKTKEDSQSVDNLGAKPSGPLKKKKPTTAQEIIALLPVMKKPRP